MTSLFRKLDWLWRRRAREQELCDEIRFHLQEEAEQREAQGLSPPEARRAAEHELGNLLLVQERTRAEWSIGGDGMSEIVSDVKHALRMFCPSAIRTASSCS